ncbi:MAG: hypothetical protein PHV02_19080 [Rhodocyclaceae bacterium]|nr:hypothetical protein [Rhodocyclaceae bacterium]
MKRKLLLALFIVNTSIAAPALAASDHASHHHDASTLQLNQGKKWETDAPLRQAMHNIREFMAAALHEIHEDRLPSKKYDTLAEQVKHQVGQIVAQCKLAPAADAQLHLIVAQLLEGAEQMAGATKDAKRQRGAIGVISALDNYATYFEDAGFKPITH